MFAGTVPTFLEGPDGGTRFMGVARPSSWNVLDGHGTPLSPLAFATITDDIELVDAIVLEQRVTTGLAVLGTISGVSLIIAGALETRGADVVLSSPASAASAAAKADAAGRLRGGQALILAGGFVTFLSQIQAAIVRVKQSYMPSYFNGTELDAAIRAHNARLRADLGLPVQEVSDTALVDARPAPTVRPRIGIGFVGINGSF
jgi:hypothetical protein